MDKEIDKITFTDLVERGQLKQPTCTSLRRMGFNCIGDIKDRSVWDFLAKSRKFGISRTGDLVNCLALYGITLEGSEYIEKGVRVGYQYKEYHLSLEGQKILKEITNGNKTNTIDVMSEINYYLYRHRKQIEDIADIFHTKKEDIIANITDLWMNKKPDENEWLNYSISITDKKAREHKKEKGDDGETLSLDILLNKVAYEDDYELSIVAIVGNDWREQILNPETDVYKFYEDAVKEYIEPDEDRPASRPFQIGYIAINDNEKPKVKVFDCKKGVRPCDLLEIFNRESVTPKNIKIVMEWEVEEPYIEGTLTDFEKYNLREKIEEGLWNMLDDDDAVATNIQISMDTVYDTLGKQFYIEDENNSGLPYIEDIKEELSAYIKDSIKKNINNIHIYQSDVDYYYTVGYRTDVYVPADYIYNLYKKAGKEKYSEEMSFIRDKYKSAFAKGDKEKGEER